jgi:hypothetical protein
VVEVANEPKRFALIGRTDYKQQPERMLVLDIQAYDWNCRQHITRRYIGEEIERAFAFQHGHVTALIAENETLKAEIQIIKQNGRKGSM